MLSKSIVSSLTLIVMYTYQHAALSPTHSPRHAPAATTRTLRQFQMLSPGLARPFDRPMLCISVYYMLCYAFTPPWIWPPLAPLHQGPLIIFYQSITRTRTPALALAPAPGLGAQVFLSVHPLARRHLGVEFLFRDAHLFAERRRREQCHGRGGEPPRLAVPLQQRNRGSSLPARL